MLEYWVPLLDFQFLLFLLWLDVSTFYALSCPLAFSLFPSTFYDFTISSNPISLLWTWGFDLLCMLFSPFPSAFQLDWTTLRHFMVFVVLLAWLMEGGWWTFFAGSRILAATSQSSSPAQFVPCSFCINLHLVTDVMCAFILVGARCFMQVYLRVGFKLL